jgi:DtxR family Mn-dependent transcriptional regulator
MADANEHRGEASKGRLRAGSQGAPPYNSSVPREDLTEAIQDYLRQIYKLQAERGRVSTSALARSLHVAPSSASAMVKKLAALDLVEHAPYRGATVTSAGERVALEVIRHHRLLEQYLAETLGMAIDEVHAEADRLEHALSEELEAVIDRRLGYPTHDPHGDPIPTADLELTRQSTRTLAELSPGEEATVRRVPDSDAELLRYLASLDLVPGCHVALRSLAPFGGPVTLTVGGIERTISREVAALIGV